MKTNINRVNDQGITYVSLKDLSTVNSANNNNNSLWSSLVAVMSGWYYESSRDSSDFECRVARIYNGAVVTVASFGLCACLLTISQPLFYVGLASAGIGGSLGASQLAYYLSHKCDEGLLIKKSECMNLENGAQNQNKFSLQISDCVNLENQNQNQHLPSEKNFNAITVDGMNKATEQWI